MGRIVRTAAFIRTSSSELCFGFPQTVTSFAIRAGPFGPAVSIGGKQWGSRGRTSPPRRVLKRHVLEVVAALLADGIINENEAKEIRKAADKAKAG
jgi:hypothetical protein